MATNIRDIIRLALNAGWTGEALAFALKWPVNDARTFLATGRAEPDRLDQFERWARHKVGVAGTGEDLFAPPTQTQPMKMGAIPPAAPVYTITPEPNTVDDADTAQRQKRFLKAGVA
ncbi:hypothetical protein DPM33_23595 [Mesorhizobium hawassense]|uniref:Uncharacterized protein n=1 Tax=Mesorhizobium hawassense TaxID=1209954 RepID=A0A330HLN8_9HYPH|nr:hypothetical protein [Mesorhizobium hawassense]RAZ88512.1 hypothetical protein DPM33_23595 [Mesorhizobium hawassense]